MSNQLKMNEVVDAVDSRIGELMLMWWEDKGVLDLTPEQEQWIEAIFKASYGIGYKDGCDGLRIL